MRSSAAVALAALALAGCDAILPRVDVAPTEADLSALRSTSGCAATTRLAFSGSDKLKLSASASGAIEDGDCAFNVTYTLSYFETLRADTHADYYAVRVEEEGRVTFTTTSQTLDTQLWLLGKNRGFIAMDDDGGGGTNARVSFYLSPGVYFVLVAGAQKSGRGSYTLKGQFEGQP